MVAGAGAAVELELGAASGVFLSPNPGEAYATPTSASIMSRVSFGSRASLGITGNVAIYPYLARSAEFADSLMAIAEATLHLGVPLVALGDAALVAEVAAGAGGYLRTNVESAAESPSVRRPVAVGTMALALRSPGRLRYAVGAHYRALFDRSVVHTVEPFVLVLLRLNRSDLPAE